MKKILCPTDFSEEAINAVDFAAHYAKLTHSQLAIITVKSMFEMAPGEVLSNEPPTIDQAREFIEIQVSEVKNTYDVQCVGDVKLSEDALPTVISNIATDYDLIIMGTSGPDDLYKFFFGSTTYHVIQAANIPVIFVPGTIRFTSLHQIVYAYDYLQSGMPPLKDLELLGEFNPEVRFLQLVRKQPSEDDHVAMARQKLQVELQIPDNFEVILDILESEDYTKSLQEYMLHQDANLLVLCTHAYSLTEKFFHKSLSRKITNDFMYPVMIVHH